MAKEYYRQCRMEKPVGEDRIRWDIAWIPEKFAQMGKYIKLKKDDGTWENGWKVVAVGDVRREKDHLLAHENDYKNQRKVSDV